MCLWGSCQALQSPLHWCGLSCEQRELPVAFPRDLTVEPPLWQEKEQPWGTQGRLPRGCSGRGRSCAEGTGLKVSCSRKATAALKTKKILQKLLKKTPDNPLDSEILQRPHEAQGILLDTWIYFFNAFFFPLRGLLSINASSFNSSHPSCPLFLLKYLLRRGDTLHLPQDGAGKHKF